MTWCRAAAAVAICGACGSAQAEWVDREIDPQTLAPQAQDPSWIASGIDPKGWPRSFSLTSRYQSSSVDGAAATNSLWGVLRATLDTPNFGALTLDAAYSPDSSTLFGGSTRKYSWTLNQRHMPFGEGWFASNAIGLVQSGNLDLVSQQYRFGVSSRLLLGGATSWANERNGWAVMGSSGSLVALDAVGQSGYADLGGQASTVGARWRPTGSPWSYALQASDFRKPDAVSLAVPGVSGQGLLQVLRGENSDGFVQVNLLGTRSQGDTWRAGGWFDAALQHGAIEHRAGLNALHVGQEWLGVPVAAGAVGGYYRWRYRTRQMLLEAQVDEQSFASINGSSNTRFAQVWANGRYQLDASRGVGLQAVASRTAELQSFSLLGYHDVALADGSWRVLAGAQTSTGQRSQWQFGGDVSGRWFDLQVNAALSMFVDGSSKVGTDAALSATHELGGRTSFTAGLRRFNAIDDASAGTSISASVQHRISAGWSASAAISDSRGARQLRAIGPIAGAPTPAAFETFVPQLRFVWLSLRYDFGAGSPEVPLGARPGAAAAGGGSIEGVVFLDANGNARLDPGEAVAAGVTVVLDGLYAVRTDAQGRYAFPFVVSGEHRLQVLPDNIPLPWSLGEQPVRELSLLPRETVIVNFAATRN